MRISDWSSDVCSSVLASARPRAPSPGAARGAAAPRAADHDAVRARYSWRHAIVVAAESGTEAGIAAGPQETADLADRGQVQAPRIAARGLLVLQLGTEAGQHLGFQPRPIVTGKRRSEEHTSELQSL